MNIIETDRLTLEPLTSAHAEEMFAELISRYAVRVAPVRPADRDGRCGYKGGP